MLDVVFTAAFKRDYKLAKRQGRDIPRLRAVVETLARGEALDPKYRDHELNGSYRNYRECHIEPDWLLIYKLDGSRLILALARLGTHSELFKK